MRKQQVIVSIFCMLASIHIVAQLSYEPILLTGVFAPVQDSIPSIHTSSTAHIHPTSTRITTSHSDINHARDLARQCARTHTRHHFQHKEHHIALDPLWLNATSSSVNTRCTVINFLNGPIGSGYPIPASPLPINFHENFDPRGWGETYVYKTPTQSDYHTAFERHYGRCSKQDRQRHIHAHMRRWAHYYYPSFRAFIKTLDGYESYMLEIAAQLEHDPLFANGVKQAEKSAPEYIRAEKSRITKARAQEAMRAEQTRQAHRIEEQHQHAAQQRTIARTTFAQQHDIVHAYINNNPSRLAAYQQALADNGSTTDHEYHLSTAACAALQHNALSYEPYLRLHGNALQHELLQEIVAGIEDLSVLARPKSAAFNELLYDHTFITFDDARFANERGDCASSAQLIDLATSMKNCLYAIITGTVTGMRDGAHSAVAGAYEMVRHPIQTAHALKHLACTLAHYAHDYLPLEILSEDTASTDWDLYARRCEETAHNWRIATDQLKKYWHDTPAPELAHQISYIAGNLSANAIVANACLHMLSKAARCVKVEITHLTYQANLSLLKSNPAVSPGFLLITETQSITQVMEMGKKIGMSEEAIQKAISIAQAQRKDLSSLIKDFEKLSAELPKIDTEKLGKLSARALEEALRYATTERKLQHFFENPAHNFQKLLEQIGSPEKTVCIILEAAEGQLPNSGSFKDIPVTVHNYIVYLRGQVIDGVPKIGTMFIK